MHSDLPRGLPTRLGITADYVQPAYEDPADRMIKQGLIPDNIDPSDPKIDDPLERARILRLFDSHLAQPAGFVLPVQRWTAQAQVRMAERSVENAPRPFVSAAREIRRSAFGCRCNRCPIWRRSTIRISVPADPFAERRPLPGCPRSRRRSCARTTAAGSQATAPPLAPETYGVAHPAATGDGASAPVRTASGGRGARRPLVRVHAAGRNAQRLS